MSDALKGLEARVEALEREVVKLRGAISNLPAKTPAGYEPAPQVDNTSEEILAWVGKSSLLPRMATVSFLLVIALILRTITDNDIVSMPVGSLMGMGYAALLIGLGWRKYRLSSPLAPVFAVCGGLLMFATVVELHAGFHYLPGSAAYFMLFATGIALGTISYLHKVAPPILVGSLGICFAGILVDYPNPHFPSLVVLLFLANALGVVATHLRRCSWLRWIVLLVTMSIVQVWGFKLHAHPGQGPESLSPDWYLPLVFLVSAAFLGIAAAAVLRRTNGRISRFDLALPAVTVAWAYAMASYATSARWGSDFPLGLSGLAAAAFLLAFAVWLARRERTGAGAFFLAGTLLLLTSLPDALGSRFLALPPAAFYALILAYYSRYVRSGLLRLLSYLVQFYACVLMVRLLNDSGTGGLPGIPWTIVAAGLLTAASLRHFFWCRANPPEDGLDLFSRYDHRDRIAVIIFVAALVDGFLMLSSGLHYLLRTGEGGQAAFQGGESILINLGAAVLLWVSFRGRNREIRNVAVLMTVIGGFKVFFFDLLSFRGLPLVAAVFSFGLTVSLLSVVLARWRRADERGPDITPGASARI